MSSFSACDETLFFGRGDSQDPRLGEAVVRAPGLKEAHDLKQFLSDHSELKLVLAGYPDDEGIRLGGGRPGASQGPDAIRRSLYRMTPGLYHPADSQIALADIGNLHLSGLDLVTRHQRAAEFAEQVMTAGVSWVSLGGGHDYGYADGLAFCRAHRDKQKPFIINFDAHLDVRPDERGASSGTPYFRLLRQWPEVDFLALGIQPQCNSRHHHQWLKERGARIVPARDLSEPSQALDSLVRAAGAWLTPRRKVYVSVDMDVFASAYAPGCSQSWPSGLTPGVFFTLMGELNERLEVCGLSIYETSPPLDFDDHTAKLAALILHGFIFAQ